MTKTSLFLAAAAVVLTPVAALAHAHVERTDPAINGVVQTSPKAVRVSFSEPVMIAFTGAEVKDAVGHVARAGKPALENGGKTLVLPIADTLKPGAYVVAWHAVSDDTHRVAGRFSFSVKP